MRIFQIAFNPNPPFFGPTRPTDANLLLAKSISSCLKIHPGLITLGRSGIKKKAAIAIGKEMTASMVKIQRHPGIPDFPWSVVWTPPWRTPERRVPAAVAAWKMFERLPSSSLVYHDPIRKTDISINHIEKGWVTYEDRGSMLIQIDQQRTG